MIKKLFILILVVNSCSSVQKYKSEIDQDQKVKSSIHPTIEEHVSNEISRIRSKTSANPNLLYFLEKFDKISSTFNAKGGVGINKDDVGQMIKNIDRLINKEKISEPVLYIIRPTLLMVKNKDEKSADRKRVMNKLILKDLSVFVDKEPSYSFTYMYRAKLFMFQKQFGLALQDINKAIEIDDLSAKSYQTRAMINIVQNNILQAAQDYHHYFFINGKLSYQLDNPENYNKFHPHFFLAFPSIDLQSKYFQAVVTEYPDYYESYSNLAMWQVIKNKNPQALHNLDKSIALNKKYYRNYDLKSSIFLKQKNYLAAVENGKKFLKYSKTKLKKSEAYLVIARSYGKMGKGKLALENFKKAEKLNSNNHKILYHRAEFLSKHKKYAPAIQEYSRAIHLKGNHQASFAGRSIVYMKIGEHQMALYDVNKAIKINDKSSLIFMQRAVINFQIGNILEGKKDIQKVKKICKKCITKHMQDSVKRRFNVDI
ncbi:MAG: tetratricopeptide (TPR) repeat protein [Lentimonas sp.]|jgi:tetratricopeptide (TPR) repeat protein